jgi:hypothetical protein
MNKIVAKPMAMAIINSGSFVITKGASGAKIELASKDAIVQMNVLVWLLSNSIFDGW